MIATIAALMIQSMGQYSTTISHRVGTKITTSATVTTQAYPSACDDPLGHEYMVLTCRISVFTVCTSPRANRTDKPNCDPHPCIHTTKNHAAGYGGAEQRTSWPSTSATAAGACTAAAPRAMLAGPVALGFDVRAVIIRHKTRARSFRHGFAQRGRGARGATAGTFPT
jgi:hypothetical protein